MPLDVKIAIVASSLLREAIADPEFPFSVMPKRHGELKEYSIGPSKGSTANCEQVSEGCTEKRPHPLMIYEDSAKQVRLVYDLPSSLMSRLGNEELMASARKLDENCVFWRSAPQRQRRE